MTSGCEWSEKSKNQREDETLLALIDKRRAELQAQAEFLGERFYAEKRDAFESRFQEYWKAWRAEEETNRLAAT